MAIDYMTDIVDGFFATEVGNDPNYESPGNFNLPASFASPSDGQKRLLTYIEVLRSYLAEVETVHEAKTLAYILQRLMAKAKAGAKYDMNVSDLAQRDALEYLAHKFGGASTAATEFFFTESGSIIITESGDFLIFDHQ